MKKYDTSQIRNVAIIGHGGTGKTLLTEAILYRAGATNRKGNISDGNTVSDFDPEEIKRNTSISTALATCQWKDTKINLLDTPGFFDFVGEVVAALEVVEGSLSVLSATDSLPVGFFTTWKIADEKNLARTIFINKMDKENASFEKVYEELREKLGTKVVPINLPIGSYTNFEGVIDLVNMKAYYAKGLDTTEAEIPDNLRDDAQRYREELVEAVVVADEEVLERYFEGEELSEDDIKRCLRLAAAQKEVFPVACGSAELNIGLQPLMNMLVYGMPAPTEKVSATVGGEKIELDPTANQNSALVFKTLADPYVGKITLFKVKSGLLKSDSQIYNAMKNETERLGQLFFMQGKEQLATDAIVAGDIGGVAKLQYTETSDSLCDKDKLVTFDPIEFPRPVLTLAVYPKGKSDTDKVASGLVRLSEEDPTISIEQNKETSEFLLSGMGDLHLEIISSRLKKKFGVEMELVDPKVPYRETVKGTAKVEGKHKKQSGGRGQYGHVWLELSPMPLGEGFVFEDNIFGGSVPKQYIPAVEKGVKETMADGVIAGYPVVDVKVSLFDGSYHDVDSSEMAFKIAASMAFKKGFVDAKPILLEPIMSVEVTVPDDYMGDVMGNLNKKRGKILGMEPRDGDQVVKALVPMSEMFRFAIELRAMTQGWGNFVSIFDHYEELPAQLAEKVKDLKEEEAN
ncbi:MAG: elongation factor G [Firmicutes bacterium]|nr:elongation factor G [Bacillota bacterium]MDD4693686.1 elongation factor G [Bacillota bacterium]